MSDQQLYIIIGNVRYHGSGEWKEKLITPDMEIAKEGLPFEHLNNAEKQLLIRKRYIKPKPVSKKVKSED